MSRNKKYTPGDTFIKKKKGVEYLMEVQPAGRAKCLKRISPYKNPKCANMKSKVPVTEDVVVVKKEKPVKPKKSKQPQAYTTKRRQIVRSATPTKKKVVSDQVINGINPLNNNKHIYIRENDLTAPVYIERRPGPGNTIAIKRHTT